MSASTTVAAFDFDGTLTRRDSLLPFLRFVAGRAGFVGGMARALPWLGGYALNLVANDRAKTGVLKTFFGGYDLAELQTYGERFSREVIPTLLRPEGIERLRWHQQQGHTTVLVSASLELYLRPWAKQMEIDDVIATRLLCANGQVSGALDGPNCYGAVKRTRLEAWLHSRTPYQLYAYGDSAGDDAMLAFADVGYRLKDPHGFVQTS